SRGPLKFGGPGHMPLMPPVKSGPASIEEAKNIRNQHKSINFINNTYTLETLILTNRIFSIFSELMTQYSYETHTLSAIIIAARTGVLHPMFYNGSQIVVLIYIYIYILYIYLFELTLFKIIPIPHPVDINQTNNKHSVVLKPEYQYLLHCTETEVFTICPKFQPIQHESKEQPCEISLFKNPDQFPQNFELGVVIISKNIFHKLKYVNTWIYTTTSDTLTITCQGTKEPFIDKIKNQGVIKLNQECRGYANQVVLNPTREIKTKYYINVIPKIGVGNISYKINNSIKEIKIEKFKHRFYSRKLDNVHEMAYSLDKIENMIDEEILRQSGVEVQHSTNSYMMYAIIGLLVFSLFLLAFIYISYKICSLTTMRAIGHQQLNTDNNITNKDKHVHVVYLLKNIKETHKFVIMDFEFSMVNKTSMVVISEAISNSLDRFKIRKLKERPLLLPLKEEARPMGETELLVAVKEIKRVFRIKTDIRDACLDQLKQSLNSNKINLTKEYIKNYIRRGNKENVIVVWNGHSDKNILRRLNLDQYPILNITCYDKYFNKNFYI
ncbi:Envelope fusion protein, partial [Aphis craccivora]